MHDMEELLSLEIKKELADRYFGFRKMIEDDSRQYNQHIREAFRQLENVVGFDLIRLYILLRQDRLIHEFFRLTGLRDPLFLDTYVLQSPTIRQRLFQREFIHGFTRRSRFYNLFMDIYNRLRAGVDTYRATLKSLVEEGKALTDEIEQFHRQNDLGTMMGFLRRLDSGSPTGEGALTGTISPQRDQYLEDKMRIAAPGDTNQLLPSFPALPAVSASKSAFRDLIDAAFDAQGQPDVRHFGAGSC